MIAGVSCISTSPSIRPAAGSSSSCGRRERHLKRLLSEYVSYHHEDRTHLGLGKGTPGYRTRCVASGRVLSHDRLGGLHHRYDRESTRPEATQRVRSEEHTSELQSPDHLVCRL